MVNRFEPNLPFLTNHPRLFWGPFQTQHLLISRQTAEHLAVIDLSFNGKVGELSMDNFSKTKTKTRHQLHPKNPLKHHKCDKLKLSCSIVEFQRLVLGNRFFVELLPWRLIFTKVLVSLYPTYSQ